MINDLVLDAEIGAYDSERGRTQKVRFNLRVSVANPVDDHGDQLDNVVCYDDIVGQIKSILGGGHINLVETLADEILNALFEDARVENATLRIEKLEAIAEAAAVGVEVSRRRR